MPESKPTRSTSTATRPTRRQLRLVDARSYIAEKPQPSSDELAFGARELVLATLPHAAPAGDPPEWTRRNGRFTLSIRPGWRTDHETGERKPIGYPYGVIPRLLLFWLTTEAVRTQSRRVEIADSLNGFLRRLSLSPDTGGGRRGDATRLREQMERLFRATISFEYTESPGTHQAWLDMQIAPRAQLWWDPHRPEEASIWGSWVELSHEFYEAIIARPVPLDLRAIRALKSSPLALDFYAWIAWRHWVVSQKGDVAFVPWRELRRQIGAEYGRLRDFKRKGKQALMKVLALYPDLQVKDVDGGLQIHPGRPLIDRHVS
ncbi:MAG: replication protein RepA [bacterium]